MSIAFSVYMFLVLIFIASFGDALQCEHEISMEIPGQQPFVQKMGTQQCPAEFSCIEVNCKQATTNAKVKGAGCGKCGNANDIFDDPNFKNLLECQCTTTSPPSSDALSSHLIPLIALSIGLLASFKVRI